MKVGQTIEMKMPRGVELVTDLKDFRDFVVYCDVMNYHPVSRPHAYEGVADILLSHRMYGIFDAHTNKGYIIDGAQIGSLSEGVNYAKAQVSRCRSKYTSFVGNEKLNESIKSQFQKWEDEVIAYEA